MNNNNFKQLHMKKTILFLALMMGFLSFAQGTNNGYFILNKNPQTVFDTLTTKPILRRVSDGRVMDMDWSKIISLITASGTYPNITGIAATGIQISGGNTANPVLSIQQASSSQKGSVNLYTGTGTSTTGGVDQNTFTTLTNKMERTVLFDDNDYQATGSTSQTIIKTYTIPANTFVKGMITLEALFDNRASTNGNKIINIYMTNSTTISGIDFIVNITATGLGTRHKIYRTGKLNALGEWFVLNRGTNSSSDYTINGADESQTTLNLSLPIYVYATVTLANPADIMKIRYMKITNERSQ